MKKKDTIVFDLDGTIADIAHRVHLVKRPRPDWPRFFKSCSGDKVNAWCLELAKAMAAAGYKIVVVSARSREAAQETKDWFAQHWDPAGFKYSVELIRAQGDSTPDQILKQAWLNTSGLLDRILFVVDDRTRVVDMWRANGLTCLQCDRWEEFKTPK
ncbi:MAG: hypothetical protein AAB320_03315 [Elusimicrobiota bacterium]